MYDILECVVIRNELAFVICVQFQNNTGNYQSFVVISDCLKPNTYAYA